jgi:hypothetical protein
LSCIVHGTVHCSFASTERTAKLPSLSGSTSANSSYVVAIGGKKLQSSMPVGWATVKYKP